MAASRRARLKGLATRATTSAAARLGLDVVPRGAYSPLARVPAAGDPSWERRLDLPGVRLGPRRAGGVHRRRPQRARAAFAVPAPFRLDNPFYGPGDAELLFALLRHEPPLRILELGSGWSTHVARAAAPHADWSPSIHSPSTRCSSRSTASPPSRPATSSSTPATWSSAGRGHARRPRRAPAPADGRAREWQVDELQDSQGNVRDELYTMGAHGYLVYKEQAYGINLGFEPGPAPGLR